MTPQLVRAGRRMRCCRLALAGARSAAIQSRPGGAMSSSMRAAQIFSAAGLMMRRLHAELPDNAPIDLNKKAVIRFIESLDVRGLRELRHVAKGLERYTAH